jgi:hypothetical protein
VAHSACARRRRIQELHTADAANELPTIRPGAPGKWNGRIKPAEKRAYGCSQRGPEPLTELRSKTLMRRVWTAIYESTDYVKDRPFGRIDPYRLHGHHFILL